MHKGSTIVVTKHGISLHWHEARDYTSLQLERNLLEGLETSEFCNAQSEEHYTLT